MAVSKEAAILPFGAPGRRRCGRRHILLTGESAEFTRRCMFLPVKVPNSPGSGKGTAEENMRNNMDIWYYLVI